VEKNMARHVHLVGSIGLDTVEDVFTAVGKSVKPYILRCPDGEVAGRRQWIGYQYPVLRSNRFLSVDGTRRLPDAGMSPMRLAKDSDPKDIHFGELGYAREARLSYQDFLKARQAGQLQSTTRFQVCLPTPFAVIGAMVVPEDVPRVLPAYSAAMLREVDRICAVIPHSDLAVQWDVCIEMLMWDGRFSQMPPFPGMKEAFIAAFQELANAVPEDVELGFHLCYGDLDAKHFVQPLDLGKAVELANLIVANLKHPIAWIHMPVPRDRDDDAYFLPLRDLKISPRTELFLGLVHDSDGAEGARRRSAAAAKVRPAFGIATECGMARARTRELVLKLLSIHAEAAM
jgi:hypothetical protein